MKTKKIELERIERPAVELARDEAEEARGGIIIVGGLTGRFSKYLLNPQPLPPRYSSFTR